MYIFFKETEIDILNRELDYLRDVNRELLHAGMTAQKTDTFQINDYIIKDYEHIFDISWENIMCYKTIEAKKDA